MLTAKNTFCIKSNAFNIYTTLTIPVTMVTLKSFERFYVCDVHGFFYETIKCWLCKYQQKCKMP